MLHERLTESINTVKDLLRTNKELREHMDKYRNENENLQSELYHLHKENQDLRERLSVFESLFNNEGAKLKIPAAAPPTYNTAVAAAAVVNSVEEDFDEDLREIDDEYEGKARQEKRSSNLVQELTQEVTNLRLTKKALENKVRDAEIENMTLQQKFLPPSLKTRKANLPEASFNSHQYYQNLITRTKYNQKLLPDQQNQTEMFQGDSETAATLQKDSSAVTQDSMYQTPIRSKADRDRAYDQTRYSSVGAENRNKTDENVVMPIGSYLPKLRTEASDLNSNNGNSSPSIVKRSTNVWLSGLFKKRANSTLRRIGTGNKLGEKRGYTPNISKTLEEMEKSVMSPRRNINK